jgi:hypothetical protein
MVIVQLFGVVVQLYGEQRIQLLSKFFVTMRSPLEDLKVFPNIAAPSRCL